MRSVPPGRLGHYWATAGPQPAARTPPIPNVWNPSRAPPRRDLRSTAVTATATSPRAAAAGEWLASYLADGPRPSGQLHVDAEQAGISYYALYKGSDALAVKRINRGRWSTWVLPEHYVPDPVEKRCDVCGEVKGIEDFRRPAARGRRRTMPACSACTALRSCRTDRPRPALAEASAAPDPRPAEVMREELVIARRCGQTFTEAWPAALAAALAAAATRTERDSWRGVFHETRAAWSAAYHREDAGHQALAMLARAA